MTRIGEYTAGTRNRVVLILGLAACLAAVMVASQVKSAGASHTEHCKDPQIPQIVVSITGQTPQSHALCHSTYDVNLKETDSYATKESKITPVLNACGTDTTSRYIAQAVIETTGNKPVSAYPSGVCNKALYEARVREVYGTGSLGVVDWSNYRTDSYPEQNAFTAVKLAMSKCGNTDISQAIIEVTGQLPKNGNDLEDPGVLGSKTFTGNGQCEYTLYNNGYASYWGYESMKKAVKARAQSTTQCGDPLITEAYRRMTGWNPLPDDPHSFDWSECNVHRYNDGQWSTFDELKNYVYHSWRCQNAWLGQIYAKHLGRRAAGSGGRGECAWHLYGDYAAGSYDFPAIPGKSPWTPYNYQTLTNRVTGTEVAMTNQGSSFQSDGDLRAPNGTITTAEKVNIVSGAGTVSTSAGTVKAPGSGNQIAPGAQPIELPAAKVIASGAGNVIASGAGNVIANGGGNMTASGAGN